MLTVEKAGGSRQAPRTEARFAYTFGDQTFTSDKVTLFGGSVRWYEPLAEALRNQQKIRVYVDSSDPRLAVIDREFRFWQFLGYYLPMNRVAGIAQDHNFRGVRNQLTHELDLFADELPGDEGRKPTWVCGTAEKASVHLVDELGA